MTMRSLTSILGALVLAAVAPCQIAYRLSVDQEHHAFDVSISAEAKSNVTTFVIPHWCPGYYTLATYESKIKDVAATSHSPLQVTQAGPRSWNVPCPIGSRFTFSYRVIANDAGLGFFGAHLGLHEGFINGASTFMYIDGRKTEPDTLAISIPGGWKVATALDPDSAGDYRASSGYDEFIDSPIQLGQFVETSFEDDGIPYKVVFVAPNGDIDCDPQRETMRLSLVSKPALDMFHGAAFKHYLYIIHLAVGDFSGGLEHRASTCIAVPNSAELNLDDLAAHENFHAWNVKQIRPYNLGPFDYTQPCRTPLLWWMEGVTDYYSKILTFRSRLENTPWLLGQFADSVSELQGSTEAKLITVSQCSEQCWEHDGFGVGDFSYYTKGQLMGLILDAAIRAETQGRSSLDDVMRNLFAAYRLPQPGMKNDGIEKAIDEVVGNHKLDALYHQMAETTDPMPYDELEKIGLEAEIPGTPFSTAGFDTEGGVVTHVDQSASDAGVMLQDHILTQALIQTPNGPALSITLTRGAPPMKLTVPIVTKPGQTFKIIEDPRATPAERILLGGWLQRPHRMVKDGDEGTVSNKQRP